MDVDGCRILTTLGDPSLFFKTCFGSKQLLIPDDNTPSFHQWFHHNPWEGRARRTLLPIHQYLRCVLFLLALKFEFNYFLYDERNYVFL